MSMNVKSRHGFYELYEHAGLGSLVWSRSSFLSARYYHYSIGLFIVLIIATNLLLRVPILYISGVIAAYSLYLLLRKHLTPKREAQFYEPRMQLVRALVGIGVISGIIVLVPDSNQTTLWLLFLLNILITSKHCSTRVFIFTSATACGALIASEAIHALWFMPSAILISVLVDSINKCLCIGLFSFILHYLVRNVQARDETINAYEAVNDLARETNLTEFDSGAQWIPLLSVLLRHLDGDTASVWLCDGKTRRIHRIVQVSRVSSPQSDVIETDSVPSERILMGDDDLVARAVSTGQFQHSAVATPTTINKTRLFPSHDDPGHDLAVPINLGLNERRVTLGAISVCFRRSNFKERLLKDYQIFIQGLIHQAQPMLIAAQRLEEMAALQQVSYEASHSLDLNQVLENVLHATVETLGFQFATVSLVDEQQNLIRCVTGLNVSQGWIKMAIHSLDSPDIQAQIIHTGKTEVITGWDPRFDKRIWKKYGHAEMIRIFVPIPVVDPKTGEERRIGTIEAGYKRSARGEITHDQKRMLEAFRFQVGLAIEHARLLQREQYRTELLTRLQNVSQSFAAPHTPAEMLDEIGRQAQSLLQANFVMVYPYDRDKHQLELPLIFGETTRRYHFNLALDHETILTRLVASTEPYYSRDALSDPHLAPPAQLIDGVPYRKASFIRRHNIKSFAGIPLIAQGEIVGVMCINYRIRHQFDELEKQAHELFAQQAAAALKNAESYELSRQLIVRQERDELSRKLHDSVSQALFGIVWQADDAIHRVNLHNGQLRGAFNHIREIANVANQETGFILDELRAPLDEGQSFLRGLEEYCNRIQKWYPVKVYIDASPPALLPLYLQQWMLRFAREGINNAVRHARCQIISVVLEMSGDEAFLSVRDDGIGFIPERISKHRYGLHTMHECAKQVGGEFELETSPNTGTCVRLRVSLGGENLS